MNWLSEHAKSLQLTDSLEGYLYSRGVLEEDIESFGLREWEILPELSPDPAFCKKYGPRGENLRGCLYHPVYNARGDIQGAEFRSYHGYKKILQYHLPTSEWNALWVGVRQAAPLLYAGGSPWIFEGLFDLAPMRHLLPNVPLLGTFRAKLSDQHVSFLKRFMVRRAIVQIVYDNDETGKREADIAAYRLREAGIICNVIKYLGGKDPGVIWDNRGLDGLREAFNI